MKTDRRTLLQAGATTAAAALIADTASAQAQNPPNFTTPESTRKGDMLHRKLGDTGETVSLVGLGGFHIGKQTDPEESIRLIRTALDRGINFMDNCWDYNNGASEIRMGTALQNGYREKAFLMTKIDGRDQKSAMSQIEESLTRLKTDHVDLLQFHEVIRLEDPDRIFAKGGAMEAFALAKKAGKTRYIGFTGHKDPLVHLRMLDVAAARGFHFDAVQMPLNVMDAHFRSFRNQVLPRLVSEKIGVLGMKTFGDHFILDYLMKAGAATPIECLHYSMTLPTSVVITGIDSMPILEQALEAVKTFKPLTVAQQTALLSRTRVAALTGEYEKFKTTPRFDGTAQNPKWLGAAA